MTGLMSGLSISHLRFEVQAVDAISLNGQPGSAIRGALYKALSRHFCSEADAPQTDDHHQRCPVCWLLALEDSSNPRGVNLPRPLTIQPPSARLYQPGQLLTLGVTLIGKAQGLLPYVTRAVDTMGKSGIGRGRGRFKLLTVKEYSPLLDAERTIMSPDGTRNATLQVTQQRIMERVDNQLQHITLDFLTPARLTAKGRLVKQPEPAIFIGRLLERCQQIVTHYSDAPTQRDEWRELYLTLSAQAENWRIAYDETQWVEVFSGSKRKGRLTPISGFVGRVRWEGEVGRAHEWLLWGQSLQVGKDTVKGNGCYRIVG